MPSFKYVIELGDQDKATLMEIVKRATTLPGQSCVRIYCLPQTSEITSI